MGRNADWIRVDGENFPAGPIEDTLRQAPGVVIAVVYGVPDDQAGDQAMAGLVVADETAFDLDEFGVLARRASGDRAEVAAACDVRVLRDPPTTGTNKIVKRTLVHQKFRHDRTGGDPCFVRLGQERFRPFTETDEAALHASFVRYGRERLRDL